MASAPTITQISGSNILATTISSNKIKSGVLMPQIEFENETISYDEYVTWGSTSKNCVIYDVPMWSAMFNMNGKTDKDGNIFVTE